MKGFKDSTKVQYMKGGSCDGYAKGGSVKGAAKISKVMGEFKRGDLHSGSKKGPEVTSKKQATAIALSEARKAGAKIPQPVQKKSLGGVLKAISPAAALVGTDAGKSILGSGAFGLTGLALNALLKKKQSGQPLTPQEQQQVDASVKQGQTAMKTGGAVKKNLGGLMRDQRDVEKKSLGDLMRDGRAMKTGGKVVKKGNGGLMKEGISTRPTDKSGRRITLADLEKSNRDTGGMGKKAVEAAGRAIASGNRMAVEEGNESRLVTRKVAPRARVTSVEDKRSYGRAEPGAMLRRGPAGAGFGVEPLVNRMRDALGLKNGGLSTMPRGKK